MREAGTTDRYHRRLNYLINILCDVRNNNCDRDSDSDRLVCQVYTINHTGHQHDETPYMAYLWWLVSKTP